MRLIDADKLPYVNKVILVDDVDGDIIITIAKEYTSYVNDETPTVKAIPIEYIEKIIYANKYLWEQNKERMFIDRGVVKIINYSMTAQILSELINRWEKENEIN